MVWETVKMSLKRANVTFSIVALRSMAEFEFVRITGEVWARYQEHAIKAETCYRAVAALCAEVEAAFADDRDDDKVEGSDLGGDSEGEGGDMSE